MAEGYDVDGPPRCVFCIRDVSKITRIVCEECSAVLCVKCYQLGPEGGEHKRGHNYQIASDTTDALFDPRFSKKDEQELIQIVHRYKLGNWDAVTQQLPKGKKRNPIEVARHFHLYFVLSTLGRTAMKEKEWIERREHFKHDIGQILGDPSGKELYYHAAMEALRACKDLPSTGDDHVFEKINTIIQHHFDSVSRSERKRKAFSMDLGMYKGKDTTAGKAKEAFPYGESEDEEWWEVMCSSGSIEKPERDRYYEDQFVCGDENCMALAANDVDIEVEELQQMLNNHGIEDAASLEVLESLKELKIEMEEEDGNMLLVQKAKKEAAVSKKPTIEEEEKGENGEEQMEEKKEEEEDHGPGHPKRIKIDELEDRLVDCIKMTDHIGTVDDIDESLQKDLEGLDIFDATVDMGDDVALSASDLSSASDSDAVEDVVDNDSDDSSDSSDPSESDCSDSDVSAVEFDYAAYETAMREAGYASEDLYSDWDEETSGRMEQQLRAMAEKGELVDDSDESSEQGEELEDEEEEEEVEDEHVGVDDVEVQEDEGKSDEDEIEDDVDMPELAGPSGLQSIHQPLLLPSGLEEEAVTSEDEEETKEEEEEEDADESDASEEDSEEVEDSEDSEDSEDVSEESDESDEATTDSEESATQTESEEEMLDRLFGAPLNYPREITEKKLFVDDNEELTVKCYEVGTDGEYHSMEEDDGLAVLESTIVRGDESDEEEYDQEEQDENEEWNFEDRFGRRRRMVEEEYVDEEDEEYEEDAYEEEDQFEEELQYEEDEEEHVHHEVVPAAGVDDYETEQLQLLQLREYANEMEDEEAPMEERDQPDEGETEKREENEEIDLDKTPEARFGDEYESAEEANEELPPRGIVNLIPMMSPDDVEMDCVYDDEGEEGDIIHMLPLPHEIDRRQGEMREERVDGSERQYDEEEEEEQYEEQEEMEQYVEDEQHSEYSDVYPEEDRFPEFADEEEEAAFVDAQHVHSHRDVPCPADCHCEIVEQDALIHHYANSELLIPSGEVVDDPEEDDKEVYDEARDSPSNRDDKDEEFRDAPEMPYHEDVDGEAVVKEEELDEVEEEEEVERVEMQNLPREESPGDEYLEEDEEMEESKEEEKDEEKVEERIKNESLAQPADPMLPLSVDTGDADADGDSEEEMEEEDEEGSAPASSCPQTSPEEDDDENTLYQLAEGAPLEDREGDEEEGEEEEVVGEEESEGEEKEEEEEEEKEYEEKEDSQEASSPSAPVDPAHLLHAECTCANCTGRDEDEIECDCTSCQKEARQAANDEEEEDCSDMECACPECWAAMEEAKKNEEMKTAEEEEKREYMDAPQNAEGESSSESDSDDSSYYDDSEEPEEIFVDTLEETDSYVKLAPLVFKLNDDEESTPPIDNVHLDDHDDAISVYADPAAPAAADLEQRHPEEYVDALESQEITMATEEDVTMDSTIADVQPEENTEDVPEEEEEREDEPCSSKQQRKTFNDDDLCGLEEEKEEEEEEEDPEDRDKTPPMLQNEDASAPKPDEFPKTPIMVIKKVHARGRTNLRVETRPRTPQNPPPEAKEGEDGEPATPPKKPKKIPKEIQQLMKDNQIREWEVKTATQLKERANERLEALGEGANRFVIAVSDSEPEEEKLKKKEESEKSTCSKNRDLKEEAEEQLVRSSRRAKSQAPKEKRKSSASPKKKTKKGDEKKKGNKRAAAVESERETSEDEETEDCKTPQRKKCKRKSKKAITSSKKDRRAKWNKKIENRKAREEKREEEKKVVVSSIEFFEQHEITYFSNVFRRIPFDVEDHGFRNRVNFKNCLGDLYNMGYSRERDDLEVEYYNEAESMISRLNITNNDGTMPLDLENEIKLAKVERYMRVLQDRRAMRNQAAEYETIPDFLQLCKKMNGERRKLKDVIRSKPREDRFETRLSSVLPRDELLEMKQAKQRLLKMRVRAERLKDLHDAGERTLDGHEHLTRVYARSKFGPSDGQKKVPQPERRRILRTDDRLVCELEKLRLLSDASSDEEGATSAVVIARRKAGKIVQ